MQKWLFLIFSLLSPLLANTLYAQIPNGEYIGNGAVTITETPQHQYFEIMILGGNGHSCYAEGYLNQQQIGVVMGENPIDQCLLKFDVQGNRLTLDTLSDDYIEACQQYCGVRASLYGEFRIPPTDCRSRNIQKERNRFKQLYDQKQYVEGENILNKVLTQCDFYLDFTQKDSIRSDLALALYHQKKSYLCLEVLNDTLALKKDFYLPPSDAENYARIQKSILFNYNLCQKATQRR